MAAFSAAIAPSLSSHDASRDVPLAKVQHCERVEGRLAPARPSEMHRLRSLRREKARVVLVQAAPARLVNPPALQQIASLGLQDLRHGRMARGNAALSAEADLVRVEYAAVAAGRHKHRVVGI